MIFSFLAFAQDDSDLELIDPDSWLPGKLDSSEDVHGVLGLEFGMTRAEVIDAMARQGCTLAYEHTDVEHNIIELGFDGYTYEEIPNVRVCVNLLADKNYLDFVIFTLYYSDKVTKKRVSEINEENIRKLGVSLCNVQEIERRDIFWDLLSKNKISVYYVTRTDETGRALYGRFCYQVEEEPRGCTFMFWCFPD